MRSALSLSQPLALALASLMLAGSIPARAEERTDERVEPSKLEAITLDEAVHRALARNPTAAIAVAEVRRAEALVTEARSGWLPTLSGNATYTRLDGDRLLGTRVIAGADALNANLLLTVPLVAAHGWTQWWHAQDQAALARLSVADVRRQLAVAVARAFLAIVVQRRVAEVSESARDTARAHYEFAHGRLVGGVGNKLDEVRADQELATDESQVAVAYANLLRTQEALGMLTGGEGPIDAQESPRLGAAPSVEVALGEAGKRSDLKLLDERVGAAHRVAHDDWADYAPLLALTFSPFYQNPPTLVNPTTGWQAQVILSVPLYDGGLRYGQARERRALEEEARLNVEAALRQVRADVRTAFETVRRADQSLAAARHAFASATTALDLAKFAYQAGATSNLEVIDAVRRMRDAETSVAIAEDTARQVRLDLLVATGRFPSL